MIDLIGIGAAGEVNSGYVCQRTGSNDGIFVNGWLMIGLIVRVMALSVHSTGKFKKKFNRIILWFHNLVYLKWIHNLLSFLKQKYSFS